MRQSLQVLLELTAALAVYCDDQTNESECTGVLLMGIGFLQTKNLCRGPSNVELQSLPFQIPNCCLFNA